MIYTECTICGCNPKPDEWSGQEIGVCFDCGQHLVLSDFRIIRIIYYISILCILGDSNANRRLDDETIYCIQFSGALEP